jgi:SlyX protein
MSSTTLEERLTELEVRFAFIEDTLAALNDTVATHDRLLGTLRVEFERMRNDLGAVRVALTEDVRHEPPPPHY